MYQKSNQFSLQLMSYLQTMNMITDLKVKTLSGTFGTEIRYIQRLTQEMLDQKYVAALNKQKMDGKEQNYQQQGWAKDYINY